MKRYFYLTGIVEHSGPQHIVTCGVMSGSHEAGKIRALLGQAVDNHFVVLVLWFCLP